MTKLQLPKITFNRADYWKVGPVYVWKWLALTAIVSLSILVLSVFGLPSLPRPNRSPPSYRFDDPKLNNLTGLVCVLDANGVVRYQGQVKGGCYTGSGKVYDAQGQLIYDGPLQDGVYEGADAKVYQDGGLIYVGEMAQNHYEGQGRRTRGNLISEGTFSNGMLEGEGKEYAGETLLREGTFSKDLLNGEGKEYQDGTLVREGVFSDGLLNGEGMRYTGNQALWYDGEFQRGLYHGQGKLYDTQSGVLVYEGQFSRGKAMGQGKLFHPSGQLLYEGTVYDSRPRADAFLGLSLTQVEAAFSEHWLLYTFDDVTAFVYPYFQLMFITHNPANLISPSEQEAQTQREREELLDALSASAQSEEEVVAEGADDGFQSFTWDMVLAPDTVKDDLVIDEVLSWEATLPGTAQPETEIPSGVRPTDWRERFSDYAVEGNLWKTGGIQTGPFVYEFLTPTKEGETVNYYLAQQDGVQTTTVRRKDKDGTVWYQSAVRTDKT